MQTFTHRFVTHLPTLAIAAVSLGVLHIGPSFAQNVSSISKVAPTADELAKRFERAAAMADAKVNAASTASITTAPQPVTPPRQPLINIDALPKPLARSGAGLVAPNSETLEALTRKFTQATRSTDEPALLAFVSLSMPATSLQRLMADAERYSATIVLRGMVGGSLTETAVRVQRLLGTRSVSWVIDPEAFKRYSVQSVPNYVFVRDGSLAIPSCGTDLCEAPSSFLRVAGDVPIQYALEQFRSQQGFTAAVDRFIAVAATRGRP